MAEAKTYRLASTFRAFLGLFAVMFVLVAGGILSQIVAGDEPIEGVVFFVVWLVTALAAFAYQAYVGVFPVTLEDDTITFRTLFRTIHIPLSAIVAVGTDWWDLNRSMPFIRHRGGKIRLLGPFEGFHDLLTRLKERNPSIDIIGL